jgi:uncharacterized protein YigA (DUF484 family)
MLYRVTISVDVMVDAKDEAEAMYLGERNADEDIDSGAGESYARLITDPSQLTESQAGSLPWRDENNHGDDETCGELAARAAAKLAAEKEERVKAMAVVRLQVPLFPRRQGGARG